MSSNFLQFLELNFIFQLLFQENVIMQKLLNIYIMLIKHFKESHLKIKINYEIKKLKYDDGI